MFVILGRENCSYCDMVKELMHVKKYAFEYYNLEVDENEKWRQLMRERELKTVPQVFIRTVLGQLTPLGYLLIGGYEKTKEWIEDA